MSLCCVQAKCMLNSKVHKKFINEFVFINHFESSQIYEHFSQHGNTDPSKYFPSNISKVSVRQNFLLYGTCLKSRGQTTIFAHDNIILKAITPLCENSGLAII